MRTITETKQVYTLAELQELDSSAFDKACDTLREFANQDFSDRVQDDSDFFQEDFLNRFGIELDWSSLAYNVGWGSEWAGYKWIIVDKARFIDAMIEERRASAFRPVNLKADRHLAFLEYGFEGISWTSHRDGDLIIDSIEWDWRTRDNETVVPVIDQWVEDVHNTVCCDLLKSIRADYEYQNSEEALLESAEANEWEFLASGKMV